ncbi:AI-2E family transporter [Curtobacterium sp. MCSS17_005]|uniref:AI-2E family transporter n=1 Tax=Curtobacterium sp. MCSS17_005 TaxID=2175641 RepID=UPI000DA81CA4|nr:AI-2E family transporter [Curtobacterium sp. MCSS17_005]WIB34367.1 AI-2E family transporter [Curtobacterium sp. MCSS17_005]
MSEDTSSTLGRGAHIAIVVGGVVLGVAGACVLAWLIAPLFLALVVVTLTYPIVRGLRARGVPSWAATLTSVITGYGMILALAAVVLLAGARLTRVVVERRSDLDQLLSGAGSTLVGAGFTTPQVHEFLEAVSPAQILRWSSAVVPSLTSFAMTAVFLSGLLIFLGVEGTQVDVRMSGIRRTRTRLADALQEWAVLTRRYFGVTAFFAVIVGGLDAAFLALLGVPHPVLWGVLAAACNFIPYVGFVIGLIPPAVIALLDGDPGTAILIVLVYLVLNSLVTTVLPAKVVGDVVGLAMYVTIASLVFWGWVLGPVGSILAVPCTLLLRAVLIDADPRAAWIAPMINSSKRNRAET